MALRYTDIAGDTGDIESDFVPRGRKPSMLVLALMFLLGIVISIMLPTLFFDKVVLTGWLCLLLGAAGWYAMLEITRSRDIILATEFQNALFASAIGFNNTFSLIIRREGSVVYMDAGFQKMFPELIRERVVTVAGMLKHGKVGTTDREKIFSALERGVYDKIIFDIRGADNITLKVVMSVEPIIRPSGFILLRAREFVEARARDGSVGTIEPKLSGNGNPLLNKSSITLFAYIMDRMNTGVYMCDPRGAMIYSNRLLEQWLGYREAEITVSNMSLKDIVHQGGPDPGTISPDNFEGEVTLRKKEGGLVKAFINQKIILGEDNKPLGCVALINNIVEKDPNLKKSLW